MTVLLGPTPCQRCGAPVTVVRRPFLFEAPPMPRSTRRLTQEQADDVRLRRAAGESAIAVARSLGLSPAAIYAIERNQSYRRTMVESETITETVPLDADGSRHMCAETNARSVAMVYAATDGSSVTISDTLGDGRSSARPRTAAVPCLGRV